MLFPMLIKGTVLRVFCTRFFHKYSLKLLKRTNGSFYSFSKIPGVLARRSAPSVSTTRTANLPMVSMTPALNFLTGTAGVIDTNSKFVTGINNTGGKFATGVNDTCGK
jgi:hypothetical protein